MNYLVSRVKKIGFPYRKKNNCAPTSLHTKINSRRIKDVNGKDKTLKTMIKKKLRKHLYNRSGRRFLKQVIKTNIFKINYLDFIKIKILYDNGYLKVKRQ